MICVQPGGLQTNKCKLTGRILKLFLKLVILSQCFWGQPQTDNPLEIAAPNIGFNAN